MYFLNLAKNNKIRIGIFIEGRFLPSYDGATNRFHYLSQFLQESEKVEVIIFHCHRGYTDVKLVKNEKFTTYLISEENYYHNLGLLATIIQKERIDILQFNDLEPILYQGAKLSKMTGAKLIYEIHYNSAQLAKTLGEKDDAVNKILQIQGEIGKNIDHAICLSNDDRKNCIENLQIKEAEIDIIPSGTDIVRNKYRKPNLKNRTVVFVGNLYFQPNENAVRILRNTIYPKLKDYDFSFIIAGDCPEKLKSELGAKNFNFIGAVKNLNKLFKKTSICIAPIFEGTGMRIKFLDCMSRGIPILTTRIATNGFIDKSNFIIEDNPEKYAKRVLDIFKGNTMIEISEKGRKSVEQNYSWKEISNSVIATYQKVLAKKTKNKSDGIETFDKPVWLKELINKKRYKIISKLPANFSFSKIQNGSRKDFELRDIVAIEGMPGAGKTTFVKNLRKDKVKTIKELHIKISRETEDSFEIQKMYLLSEREKYAKASKSFKKFEKIVLDRSFISTLAYCYANCMMKKNFGDYSKLLDLLEKHKHEILLPTKIIILDCATHESIMRRKKFKNNPMYKNWFDQVFLENLMDFYRNELHRIIRVKTVSINTTHTTIPETDIVIRQNL